MKLSRLYSDDDGIFPPISFKAGLNVVFAKVKSKDISRDSHNLGKTFLISVIDYCLLGDIGKNHPFKNDSTLKNFVFYIEIEVRDDLFVTVRRKVKGRNTVSIHSNKTGQSDLIGLKDDDWQHANLSLENAKKELGKIFALTGLGDYPYRKGLGYVLRRQSDYDDVFRLTRFAAGKDIDWKPFVAMLLGFKEETIRQKYEIDAKIEELEKFKTQLEKQAEMGSGEIDKLTGIIEVKEREAERIRRQVNQFDFYDIEEEISETTVEEIETSISEKNKERYHMQSRLQNIKKALQSNFEFEPTKVQNLFAEMGVLLPDALVKSYDQLVAFNRQLTSGRMQRLEELRTSTLSQLGDIETSLEELNGKRKSALETLQQKETLEKYRTLIGKLREEDLAIAKLRERLAKLDAVTSYETQKETLVENRANLVKKIKGSVRRGNSRYKRIREFFSTAFSSIVNAYAVMSVEVNKNDNLEFNIQTLDRERGDRKTDEGKGFSYKKLLCVCFDLALVVNYADEAFYKFVYHDGVFEALDNRKKVALIDLIRATCESESIQYILTVIDTDLPRDEKDSKLLFNADEIVRELHDDGDNGRLFRMQKF